jgi:hypothetical protein
VAYTDEKKYVYKVLMGKHEAKRSLVEPRNRQNNMKINIQRI